VLDLLCLRPSKEFSIKVTKNGASYVEIYAKGHETEAGCRLVDDSSLDHFYFNVSVDDCGVTMNTTDNTYHLTVYVAGQAVILTSRDSLYEAGCDFEAITYKVSSVNDPNAADGVDRSTRTEEEEESDRVNRTSRTDSKLSRSSLSEGRSLDELQLEIFSVNDGVTTNTANVGDPIQLFIVLDPNNAPLENIDYTAECYLYSDANKLSSTRYQLTSSTGCSVATNDLFFEGLTDVPQDLIPNRVGIMTPQFATPYYPSTGLLYFECFVDLCGDECSSIEPPECPVREQRSYDYEDEYADYGFGYEEPDYQKPRKVTNVIYVTDRKDRQQSRSTAGSDYSEGRNCIQYSRPYMMVFLTVSFVIIVFSASLITVWVRKHIRRVEKLHGSKF